MNQFAVMINLSDWAIALATDPVAAPAETGMNALQAIVLGIVQGLTEFLPISSTAHIKAVPVALGWGDPGVAFTAFIQLGSIAAILWYFWSDLMQVVTGSLRAIQTSDYKSSEFRVGVGIIIGTIPIVVLGLMMRILIPNLDESPIRSMGAIAIASIVMSILLALAEYLGSRKRAYEDLGMSDGILMGCAQALALIPGVSRSGSTLTAGLFMGIQRSSAARFSFLLGIPAITLAGIVGLKDLVDAGFGEISILALVGGFIASTVSSYAAIAWLIRYLQNHNTWIFVWYRLAFGVVILGSIWAGLLQNR